MEDVLFGGSSVNEDKSLDWSRRGIEDIWCAFSCVVIPSEDFDSLSEDCAPLSSFFFFSGGIHGTLEV